MMKYTTRKGSFIEGLSDNCEGESLTAAQVLTRSLRTLALLALLGGMGYVIVLAWNLRMGV